MNCRPALFEDNSSFFFSERAWNFILFVEYRIAQYSRFGWCFVQEGHQRQTEQKMGSPNAMRSAQKNPLLFRFQ